MREITFFFYDTTSAEINLSPQASWYQNGITVTGASNGTFGSSISQLNLPYDVTITNDDVLYITDMNNHRVVVVHPYSTNNISVIGSGMGSNASQFNLPTSLFFMNTSLYILDHGNHRVQKTSLDGSNPSTILGLIGFNNPYYLYVDNGDNIYLSDAGNHSVLLFRANSTTPVRIAGNGTGGSSNNQLNSPYGLFVNRNGTVYIADCYNHRVMKWTSGASAGVLLAGNGTYGVSSTQLSLPTQVIVDTNEYLYISEYGNSRITRWAANSNFGVCIAACSGTLGTASTQLNRPVSLAFDKYGSLYVSDTSNNRVQKFQIFPYNSEY